MAGSVMAAISASVPALPCTSASSRSVEVSVCPCLFWWRRLRARRQGSAAAAIDGGQRHPQAPPQQPPPPRGSVPEAADRPPTDTVESSFTVSLCPCGHWAGAEASAMGRLRSKVAPHARQRYSYRGTREAYVTPVSRGSGGAERPAGTADGCPLACPFWVAGGGAGGPALAGPSS